MAKICILGSGYLANALKKKIGEYSWYPTKDTKVIYYLGGTTHLDFEKNPTYFSNKEDSEISQLLGMKYKIIYPSSALVYESDTKFTNHKKGIENYILADKGIVARIFPVYGYEKKTFIGQTLQDIKENKNPTIYGDGSQTRDFVFLDDVVDELIRLSKEDTGIYNIGTGEMTSFNSIVYLINKQLGKNIEPTYIEAPKDYIKEGVRCKKPLSIYTPIEEAIKKLCVV